MKKQYILRIKNTNFDFNQKIRIMGIVNTTPDSFSDGGLYLSPEKAVDRSFELIDQGADIIDIGGESSRPGSDPVSAKEEIERTIPVIRMLRKKSDILISIDTTKASVAEIAIEEGVDIINDISSFRFDPKMPELISKKNIPVILMHMKGTPKTMQMAPFYKDLFGEISRFFEERIKMALSYGIDEKKIIIDPGIGFGKRIEDNLAIINNLDFLNKFSRPILIGISRKSFIGSILDKPVEQRLEGSIAASVFSILRGVHILRVHDVEATRRAVQMTEQIRASQKSPCSQPETGSGVH